MPDEHFSAFLDESVRLMTGPGVVGVFVNARIHHTLASRLTLEGDFDRHYHFLPAYTPHLNSIEPCFALVKEWIRHREIEALADPVAFIKLAFGQCAVGGPPVRLTLLLDTSIIFF